MAPTSIDMRDPEVRSYPASRSTTTSLMSVCLTALLSAASEGDERSFFFVPFRRALADTRVLVAKWIAHRPIAMFTRRWNRMVNPEFPAQSDRVFLKDKFTGGPARSFTVFRFSPVVGSSYNRKPFVVTPEFLFRLVTITLECDFIFRK